MSHDSGFRQGAHDFSHKPPRTKWGKSKATKSFDRRLAERFREHEQQSKAQPDTEDTKPDETA